jgi:Ca2+-binding RTX toxin-like protein
MAFIPGTNFSEALFGTAASDTIDALGGNDFLGGVGGDDFLSGGAGIDKLNGGAGNDRLDGGSETDTADYSNAPQSVDVRLTTGVGTDGTGGFDTLISIENIDGSNFSDGLVGDNNANLLRGNGGSDSMFGGSGNDTLLGGSGNDALNGELGKDLLKGGSDADTFRFADISHSGVGAANRDVIADFVHGQDKIDLGAIDARGGTVGNQAFAFIGAAAFSAEGQVRVVTDGDHMLVQMNTSGTSGVDSEIELTGHLTVTAIDFTL